MEGQWRGGRKFGLNEAEAGKVIGCEDCKGRILSVSWERGKVEHRERERGKAEVRKHVPEWIKE